MSTLPSKKYILYAEDDVDDQLTFREMITGTDGGFDLIIVNNGLELMQYLNSISSPGDYPCCIVLDINMPIQDGMSTLHQLRQGEQYSDIPIVMFTTSNNSRDKTRSEELGATAYLTKPSRSNEFRSIAMQFMNICDAFGKN